MTESITLAGGCFWCIEAILEGLKGVSSAVSGYAGGQADNPTYEQVCSGQTGHAEAVQVSFDPTVISLHDILTVFFTLHDPTTLNRQGADVGTQYRSAIFYASSEQETTAKEVMAEITETGIWSGAIVTELSKLHIFYPAEEYHQHYFAQHGNQGYCQIVIQPKVSKLRHQFLDKLKI